MRASVYLNELQSMNDRINRKLDELSLVRSQATSISIATDSERVQSSVKVDKIDDVVVRIIELEEEIDKLTDEYCNRREEMKILFDKLDDKFHCYLMYKRYIGFMSLYMIAQKDNAKYSFVKYEHKKAMAEFQKILDNVC